MIESLLLGTWYLWLRAAFLAAAGYQLCHRGSYAALVIAGAAAYCAYASITLFVDFRAQILEEIGMSYLVQGYTALLAPFVFMALGLFGRVSSRAEPAAGGKVE